MRCGEGGSTLIPKPDLVRNTLEKQVLLAALLLHLSTCEHEVLQLPVDGKINGEIVNLLVSGRATVPPLYYDKIKYAGPPHLLYI